MYNDLQIKVLTPWKRVKNGFGQWCYQIFQQGTNLLVGEIGYNKKEKFWHIGIEYISRFIWEYALNFEEAKIKANEILKDKYVLFEEFEEKWKK